MTGSAGDTPEANHLVSLDYSASTVSSSIAIIFGNHNVLSMGAAETAGVVSQQNWNGAYGNSGIFSGLLDNLGNTTDAEVSWFATNQYYTNIPDQPGSPRMMKGYLDNSNASYMSVQVT